MSITGPKSILISGAARGIGRCLARTFLEKGHKVYILDIDESELSHVSDVHLKKYSSSSQLRTQICNLRDPKDIRGAAKKAADFFGGKIDVLINNGGIANPYWKDGKTMESEETLEQWVAYLETNLTAPFVLSQACIPFMKASSPEEARNRAEEKKEPGPVIIHVGSFRGFQSDPNQEGYASTKAGLLGLMHSMAISCEPLGIRVNLIAPGRIKVEHECKEGDEKGLKWHDTLTEDDYESHPTNRAGMPEDIVQAAEYFMEAGFVTGQDLTVDGGATKRKNKS
jgi:NAD(P)-dependent dehydrogenase (short-subunit alcohol dehydrogenase family)